MIDLFQPRQLGRATAAASLTTLVCYPRLNLWLNGHASVWLFVGALLWSSFFLWDFVFAWHEKYSGKPVWRFPVPGKLFLTATLCGVGGGITMRLFLDPVLRSLTPQDYPRTFTMWVAMTLFTLALEQLFLCFATFAFFIRLSRKIKFAIWGTVLFALFVMALKLKASPTLPPFGVMASLALIRFGATWLTLHFYLEGGALLVWWWVLVFQARHLVGLGRF